MAACSMPGGKQRHWAPWAISAWVAISWNVYQHIGERAGV